jgi:hypothetical protein
VFHQQAYHAIVSIPTAEVIMVGFSMAQYSVRESDGFLTVCLQLTAGPLTKERNVSIRVFSMDETATGVCKLPP